MDQNNSREILKCKASQRRCGTHNTYHTHVHTKAPTAQSVTFTNTHARTYHERHVLLSWLYLSSKVCSCLSNSSSTFSMGCSCVIKVKVCTIRMDCTLICCLSYVMRFAVNPKQGNCWIQQRTVIPFENRTRLIPWWDTCEVKWTNNVWLRGGKWWRTKRSNSAGQLRQKSTTEFIDLFMRPHNYLRHTQKQVAFHTHTCTSYCNRQWDPPKN